MSKHNWLLYSAYGIWTLFLPILLCNFSDMVCSVAGITSDANVLTNELRLIGKSIKSQISNVHFHSGLLILSCFGFTAQRFQLNYGEPMPCEQLVSYLCDIKQAYTQYGGKRPFGVSILYMGWDKHYGYQLYQSDPSGNYGGWKATCIGNNSGAAISILKQELSDEPISLSSAEDLAVKVLSKSLDMTKLTSEKGKYTNDSVASVAWALILCNCLPFCLIFSRNGHFDTGQQ